MRVVTHTLGHTQTATKTDLYSHVIPAPHREVAGAIDRILSAGS